MLRNLADNNTFGSAQNQSWITDAAFSGYVVLYREADGDNTNNGVIIFTGSSQNPHRVTWDDNNAEIEIRVVGSTGNAANVVLKIGKPGSVNANGGTWEVGTYMLAAWSYEPTANQLSAWAQTPDSKGKISGSATHTGTLAGLNDTGWTSLWAGGAGEAFLGNYLYKAGTGEITAANFDTMYAALMPNGSVWGVEKAYAAVATPVFDIGCRHTTAAGAKIGDALTTTNLEGRVAAGGSQLAVHTLSSVTGTITIVDPEDYPPAGGWTRIKPGTGVSAAIVDNPSPIAKKLGLDTADQLYRVGDHKNSRSVGVNDGDGGDGSSVGGLQQARLATLAGVLCASATTSSGSPRLMFNTPNGPATTGTVQGVSNGGANNQADFSRFWTGSGQTGSNGPGAGLYLASGATYARGAFSDAGGLTGLVTPSKTLHFRSYYLKFPGAGTLRRQTAKGTADNALSTLGSTSDIACSTATGTHAYATASDSYSAGTPSITLATALSGAQVGDVIFNANRTAIAEIASISGAGPFVYGLRHAFQTAPQDGDTLHFGPYEYAAVDATLAADATNVWRGEKFTAVGGPVVVFAHDAWVDEPGWVIGGLGQGGNGFDTQLSNAMSQSWRRVYAALQLDLVLQGQATQGSGESFHDEMYAEIVAGLPGAEVFQVGDTAHSTSSTTLVNQTNTSYHNTVLALAASEGIAGISLLEHNGTGEYGEQVVRGWREDTAHWSARGAKAIALVLLAEMATLTDAPAGGGAPGRGMSPALRAAAALRMRRAAA